MTAERSPQQLDPLGTLAAWTLTPLACLGAFGYALLSTWWHRDQVANPQASVLSLALLLAAIIVLLFCVVPRSAPLRRSAFIVVLVLAASAAVMSTVSMWGLDRLVQDDWGQMAFVLLLVSMTQLRPAVDLAVGAGVGAVVIGTVAALPASHYAVAVGAAIYGIVAATPILVLGLGGTTYARVMVHTTELWQQSAREGMSRLEPDVHATALRAAHQEQLTLLNANAVSLYTRVIERGDITADDIGDAAVAARYVRQQALGQMRSGWLHDLLNRVGVASEGIDDPDGALAFVTVDQRAAFGAFIAALVRLERERRSPTGTGGIRLPMRRTPAAAPTPPSTRDRTSREAPAIRIRVVTAAEGTAQRARVVCSAEIDVRPRVVRGTLLPYLSVLRVVSRGARLRVRSTTVTLGFDYDTV